MKGYRDDVHFDSVAVLESLPINERRTGRQLVDQVLRPLEGTTAPLRVYYNLVTSRSQFFQGLDAVEQQLIDKGSAPILHLEAHGTEDGIILADGDLVLWEELRAALTRMNEKCGLNLLLVMAMCRGWYLIQIVSPTHQTPVWGLVGPAADILDSHLFDATSAFYKELLDSYDMGRAVDAMNQASPGGKTYELVTAELMLCRVFDHYVSVSWSEDRLQERENEIVAERLRRTNDCRVTTAIEIRKDVRRQLRDHRAAFQMYRNRFLMIDAIPKNKERFKLTYEDCHNNT